MVGWTACEILQGDIPGSNEWSLILNNHWNESISAHHWIMVAFFAIASERSIVEIAIAFRDALAFVATVDIHQVFLLERHVDVDVDVDVDRYCLSFYEGWCLSNYVCIQCGWADGGTQKRPKVRM